MSIEESKDLIRRIFDVIRQGDDERASEVLGQGYVMHQNNHGAESAASVIPVSNAVIEDLVAEGDKVATRSTFEGTVTGEWKTPWGTFRARDKHVVFSAISIDRIENGKSVEAWVMWDYLGLLLQLGATITPPQAD